MLLLEPDNQRRQDMATALRAWGLPVTAVGRIAEIERWPIGEVVIVDAAWFTPWWLTIGANHVIVQVDTAEEGMALCSSGASAWVSRHCEPAAVVSALLASGMRAAV